MSQSGNYVLGKGVVVSVGAGTNISITGTVSSPIVNVVASPSFAGSVTAGTGLTVTSGGLTVTAGGATITNGGLDVVAGGAIIAGNVTFSSLLGVLTANSGSAISASQFSQYKVLVGGASNAIVGVGPGGAGQLLQSNGAASNPGYTNATYPTSTTANQLLYSSATNVVGGVTIGDYGVLISNSSGTPSWLSNGTTGQFLVATASNTPSWQTVGYQPVAYTYVNFVASPYTVLATDYYLSADVTGGAITINLPNAPATGRTFVVIDQIGDASSNHITVTTVGGVVDIDGATTSVMNSNYESQSFLFNGTSYEVY